MVGSGHGVEVGEIDGILDHTALARTLGRSASRPAAVSSTRACLRQHRLLRHADGVAHLLAAAAVQSLLGEAAILIALRKYIQHINPITIRELCKTLYLLLLECLGTLSGGGGFVSGALELQRLGLVRALKQLLLMRGSGSVLETVLDVFDALLGLLLQQVRGLGGALARSSGWSSGTAVSA